MEKKTYTAPDLKQICISAEDILLSSSIELPIIPFKSGSPVQKF